MMKAIALRFLVAAGLAVALLAVASTPAQAAAPPGIYLVIVVGEDPGQPTGTAAKCASFLNNGQLRGLVDKQRPPRTGVFGSTLRWEETSRTGLRGTYAFKGAAPDLGRVWVGSGSFDNGGRGDSISGTVFTVDQVLQQMWNFGFSGKRIWQGAQRCSALASEWNARNNPAE